MSILVLGNRNYKDWLGEDLINQIEESGKDLVIFTGGPDVPPILYKERNVSSYEDIDRVKTEISVFTESLKNNTPMLGICYGSQFLTAMQPGGKVIQNVTNHAMIGTHSITTDEGEEYEITSTHHQMMNPFNVKDHKIIAHSSVKLSTEYKTGIGDIDIEVEPEIVYYPNTNCLAIQGHPEFSHCPEETKKYCRNLIKKYLLK